ncbi:hypothetical protein JOE68_004884 [Saccharothrix algeriensis]|uniref:Uncharacterized protein n=1 Tax=Saccharothrix algeriensis TaxID=173560 RepID=A0ABS2SEH9_9PSEU|nr:hypothetical protein [Saccharothrix algeriensis]
MTHGPLHHVELWVSDPACAEHGRVGYFTAPCA